MKKATVVGIIIFAVVLTGIVLFGVFFTVGTVTVRFENDVTSVNKDAVYSAIPIDSYTNIFSVNEKKVKEYVESSFPGNVISVTSVVRSFPNSVAVVVRERTPVFRIAHINPNEASGSDYVVSDKDFRRFSVYSQGQELPYNVVIVEGFYITDSFAVEGCYQLKNIVSYFISKGFAEGAITAFMKKVVFNEDDLIITLFDNATFTLSKDNIIGDLDACYNNYSAESYSQRVGKNF